MTGKRAIILNFAVLASIFIRPELVFASKFNRTTGLINIPIARVSQHGGFSVGLSQSFWKVENQGVLLEKDASFYFSLANRAEIGATMLMREIIVGNIKIKLLDEGIKRPAVAIGVQNLSGTQNFTSNHPKGGWKNNNSFYVVASKDFRIFMGHLGIGTGRFISHDPEFSKYFKYGLFFGIEKQYGPLKIPILGENNLLTAMGEFDGRDFNVGFRLATPYGVNWEVAYTEIEHFNKPNPDSRHFTGKVPNFADKAQFICLGLSFNLNSFKKIRELFAAKAKKKVEEKKPSELITEDVGEDKVAKGEEIVLIGMRKKEVERVQADRVVEHLEAGLYYYGKGMDEKAAMEYKKVLQLDPNNILAHKRLGSFYYLLGMKDEAIKEWKKALELDPKDQNLREHILKKTRE